MVKGRMKHTRMSEYDERAEMIKMAEYIYKRPDNTKAEEYTLPIDILNYEVDPKTSTQHFNYKQWYAHKIESIYPGNIDKLAQNKVKLRMQPQYVRNLFTDTQSENVYERQYSSQPTFIQKHRNTSIKGFRKNKKFRKPILVTNKFHPYSETVAKNRKSKIDSNLRSGEIAAEIAKLRQNYLGNASNILRESQNISPANDTDAYKSLLIASIFGFLPRFDYNLRKLEESEHEFNPYSMTYKFSLVFCGICFIFCLLICLGIWFIMCKLCSRAKRTLKTDKKIIIISLLPIVPTLIPLLGVYLTDSAFTDMKPLPSLYEENRTEALIAYTRGYKNTMNLQTLHFHRCYTCAAKHYDITGTRSLYWVSLQIDMVRNVTREMNDLVMLQLQTIHNISLVMK
ncbi:uncharacterized protein LOC113238745, partial [Hyposmocoma kahamanoa]